jgi:hypothetical protein
MLNDHDVEEIVRASLDPASGLVISTSVEEDGYLSLTIHTSASTTRPDRAHARILTSGIEMFLLVLDDQFEYRDFDWETEGQRQILALMAKLAEAYLAGGGREGLKGGIFGRRHSQLTLELAGQTYVFSGRRV